jgi:5S rRNA maturation endonuclease (ribonuclease M5)
MSNIFAELQQMSSSDSSITDSRKSLNDLTAFMQSMSWQDEMITYFAELRQLKVDTIRTAGGFMVPDDLAVNAIPEEFHHDSLGFIEGIRLVYAGRFVFPVKDVRGDVAGFVGYDKFEEPKYLDSRNHGYKAKQGILFGMERMREFYEDGYVIVTEGSMCKLWLQEQGFNSLSALGSYLSPYMIEILKRFGRRCFIFPDSDEAGNKFKKQIRYTLPQAQIRQCLYSKDIDDSSKDVEGTRVEAKVAQFSNEIQLMVSNPFFRATQFSA